MERIASVGNIEKAVGEALRKRRKHNALTRDAVLFLKDRVRNVALIRESLLSGNMPEMKYKSFIRHEHGKKRRIDWNPSFRDNVVQHAIVRVLGPLLVAKMIPDTYSGIKGRGPSYGLVRLRRHVRKFDGRPLYILKIDIRQFYASVDTRMLKATVRRFIKDKALLRVLDHIIDSHPNGLPIGNYISQMLANLYLTGLDRMLEARGLVVMRYCDDIVMMSDDKNALWGALLAIKSFLACSGLSVKPDLQMHPVECDGVDFMGFVVERRSVRLRKRIERSFRSASLKFSRNPSVKAYASLAAYNGWTQAVSRGGLLWKRVVGRPLKQCLGLAREAECA